MTEPARPHRFPIVIALDGSEYSEIVLEHALDQAARHDAPDLHVITVVEKAGADLVPVKSWLARSVLEGLDAFRAGKPDWRTRLHVRVGKPDEEIVNLAAEVKADLIVIGSYGLHHARHSLANDVVASAPCPTLVVGLAGHEEGEPQCPDCVRVREESDGERWFCSAHAAPDRMRLSTLVPSADVSFGVW